MAFDYRVKKNGESCDAMLHPLSHAAQYGKKTQRNNIV